MGRDLEAAAYVLLAASNAGVLAASRITDDELLGLIEAAYSARAQRERLAMLRMFTGEGLLRVEAERCFGDDDSPVYDIKMTLSAEGLPTVTLAQTGTSSAPKGTVSSATLAAWADRFHPSHRDSLVAAFYSLLATSRRYIAAHSRDFRYSGGMVDEFTLNAPISSSTKAGVLEGFMSMEPGNGSFNFTLEDWRSGRTVTCVFQEEDVTEAINLANQQVTLMGQIEFDGTSPVSINVTRMRLNEGAQQELPQTPAVAALGDQPGEHTPGDDLPVAAAEVLSAAEAEAAPEPVASIPEEAAGADVAGAVDPAPQDPPADPPVDLAQEPVAQEAAVLGEEPLAAEPVAADPVAAEPVIDAVAEVAVNDAPSGDLQLAIVVDGLEERPLELGTQVNDAVAEAPQFELMA